LIVVKALVGRTGVFTKENLNLSWFVHTTRGYS
jgi:hypothetical protein